MTEFGFHDWIPDPAWVGGSTCANCGSWVSLMRNSPESPCAAALGITDDELLDRTGLWQTATAGARYGFAVHVDGYVRVGFAVFPEGFVRS